MGLRRNATHVMTMVNRDCLAGELVQRQFPRGAFRYSAPHQRPTRPTPVRSVDGPRRQYRERVLEWIPWQDAAKMAAATATTWGLTRRSERSWGRILRPWAKELTLILLLYGLWQYAGEWSLGHVDVALARGQRIWDVERALLLPSERATQAVFLHHRLILRGFNEFYAFIHTPALAICLIWLFVRHRDRYPPVRTVLALVTGASLAIQLFPVAPPRLLPLLGVVDTGALIGPRVYTPGAPGLDQLSAMPSLHVGWSIVIAGAIVWVCRRPWRWLAVVYPILTLLTVVVTGNHFWADGIVVAVLCAGAALIVAKAYARPPVVRETLDTPPDLVPEPVG
ncbi:MAG: hypothetical protein QOJ52_633 [Acidimicrobiaceae bacterium]|nr:hypothetical protein [Acidimicrobiaceae bacterium]